MAYPNPLHNLQDSLSRHAFGETAGEAIKKGACVKCKQPHRYTESDDGPGSTWTDAGRREIGITGICEHCFDEMFAEDEDGGDA